MFTLPEAGKSTIVRPDIDGALETVQSNGKPLLLKGFLK